MVLPVRGTPFLKNRISFYPSYLIAQHFHGKIKRERERDSGRRTVPFDPGCPREGPGPCQGGAPPAGERAGCVLCFSARLFLSEKATRTDSEKGLWAQICTYTTQKNSICPSAPHSYMLRGRSQKLTRTAGRATPEPLFEGHAFSYFPMVTGQVWPGRSHSVPPMNTDPRLGTNRCGGQLGVMGRRQSPVDME